jgi:hypothetical protein
MWTRDNVCRYKAITDSFASVSAGTDRSIYSTSLPPDHDRYVTSADELSTDQANFGSLRHCIRSFNCRDKTARFDHS